ncbi:2Fe-2S iron-sulfur cluster binding domain-containing protein [bacterium]|nr:2Fe-2S iron-sulfur cluster binding domain-containing protein [bacterium]
MGGKNPYIKQAEVDLPTKKYKVTFLPDNVTIEVDPADLPYSRDGLPGSILDLSEAAGVAIDHACGGVCACSTCHVYIREGLKSCNPATDDEEDMLDQARGLEPVSRLGCQCVPNGAEDVVVEIPSWNRNLVKENH